jgi:hypothetical protein
MALVTANKLPVISAKIDMPRLGAWTADLMVDTPQKLTGRVTIECARGLTLVGTVTRGDVWQDSGYVRVSAGNDGLRRTAKKKFYRAPNMRTVLADLLRAANETLSGTSDSGTIGTSYPAWTVIERPVGEQISALLMDRRLNVVWRMLPDGTLFVGPETWPESPLRDNADYQRLVEAPQSGCIELGVESPTLLPGVALGGRRTSYVKHAVDAGAVRTTAWVEA